MLKTGPFILLIFLFLINKTFSQNSAEIATQLQLFIEGTTQMPFSAKVANINGVARVRVTLSDSVEVPQYQIAKGLSPDCNAEALRVIKLVNIKNIKQILGSRKAGVFEVLFQNTELFAFQSGFKFEYINEKNEIVQNEGEAKFLRKYAVDSTSGIVTGKIEYFKIEGKKIEGIGYYNIKVDSTERHSVEILENAADTLAIITKSQEDYNSDFPNSFGSYFSNGQIARKFIENKTFYYYPNGRIKSIISKEKDSENVKHWYSNGHMAFEKTIENINTKPIENYIFLSDTLGKPYLLGEKDLVELYEGKDIKLLGELTNGKKNGVWVGKLANGNDTMFTETYKNGEFLKGINIKNNIEYNEEFKNAEFNGGSSALGSFLQKNLRYPIEAQTSGIQGKVFVSFYVCTDGSLCDFEVLRSAGKALNKEALRVVKLQSGKWKPGQKRGENMKTKFNLPISFILQ